MWNNAQTIINKRDTFSSISFRWTFLQPAIYTRVHRVSRSIAWNTIRRSELVWRVDSSEKRPSIVYPTFIRRKSAFSNWKERWIILDVFKSLVRIGFLNKSKIKIRKIKFAKSTAYFLFNINDKISNKSLISIFHWNILIIIRLMNNNL